MNPIKQFLTIMKWWFQSWNPWLKAIIKAIGIVILITALLFVINKYPDAGFYFISALCGLVGFLGLVLLIKKDI